MTTLNNRLQLALLNRKKGKNALEKGFTLVELMIVIVIVGILSAVALPNFLSQTEKAKLTEARSKMSAILKEVHAEYQLDGNAQNADDVGIASATTNSSTGVFTYAVTEAGAPAATVIQMTVRPKPNTGSEFDQSLITASGGNTLNGCVNLTNGKVEIGSDWGDAVTCN